MCVLVWVGMHAGFSCRYSINWCVCDRSSPCRRQGDSFQKVQHDGELEQWENKIYFER